KPAPVPRRGRVHRDARRRDAEALAHLPDPRGEVASDHGTTGTCARPVASGSPNIRFMFCTACPAAPFTRLSITERITSVSPLSGRWMAIRHILDARTERV